MHAVVLLHLLEGRIQVEKVWCFNNAAPLSHCSTHGVSGAAVFTFKLNYPPSIMNAISFFHPRIQHSGSVVVSKEKKKKSQSVIPHYFQHPNQKRPLPLKATIHHSNKGNRGIALNVTFSQGFAVLSLFCPFLSTGTNNSVVLKIAPDRHVNISVIMPCVFPTFISCLLFTTMDYSSPARRVRRCKSSLMSVETEWVREWHI